MYASLRALLSGIIDYAGLFPPAALPMEQAVRNYSRYRQGPDRWMLGHFICSATRVKELADCLDNDPPPDSPWHLSILGENRRAEEFRPALADAMAAIAFLDRRDDLRLTSYEGKLPAEALDPSHPAHALLKDLNRPFSIVAPVQTHYYEAPLVDDWRSSIPRILAELAQDRDGGAENGKRERLTPGGFKLRCGGLEAAAFPSCEQVAFVIAACRDAKVPLKFTAGLHHPIRHYNAGVRTHMHGFINVFVAGVLARVCGLSAEQLQPILEDEEATHFRFDDAGLRWNNYFATSLDTTVVRRSTVGSFGSCSFDEPRDDLRALGWLP